MSAQNSSGNRFEALEVEADDEDSMSDSLVQEMNISREIPRYPTQISTRDRSHSSSSRVSPINTSQMKPPPDFYPGEVPSGTQESEWQTSGLQFVWDHYRRESLPYDEVGADALETIFEQNSKGSQGKSSSQQKTETSNIADDLIILRETGFNIDYPGGKLGEGYSVYRGTYGSGGKGGNPSQFAVKIIDFAGKNDFEALEQRECFETEKYILTNAFHKNIVSIRMIINMGIIQSFPFRDNQNETYLSSDRIYIILDFADCGDLETWYENNLQKIQPWQRISIARDLFWGMSYLHSINIVHGDAHSGNVLLFTESDGMVAKWTDFGLGFVGSDKQYKYRKPKSKDLTQSFRDNAIHDLLGLHSIFRHFVIGRRHHLKRGETPQEKQSLDQIVNMTNMMKDKTMTSLNQIYQQFKGILEDELIFNEQHFE